jgi:hypothetical protein
MINAYGYVSDGSSGGTTQTNGRSESTGESLSHQEVKVPGLTPKMITQVNGHKLLSLVHARGVSENGLTPTDGIPTLVQGLWPFPRQVAKQMTHAPWPLNPPRTDDYYFRKWPSRDKSLDINEPQQRRPIESCESTGPEGVAAEPTPHTEVLREKLAALARKLAHHMVKSPDGPAKRASSEAAEFSIARLAAENKVPIELLIRFAEELGIGPRRIGDPLTREEAAVLLGRLQRERG